MTLTCISLSAASSFNEPHAHQGKVTPFSPGDPNIKLDSKAIKILNSGQPYQTQTTSGTSGRGIVVQDVDAPIQIIWKTILDFDNYNKMVPKTIESKNYNVEKVKATKKNPLSQIIYTRMKVGFPVLKLEFFVKHLYYENLNSLTWTLDYTKKSDFDDSCGFWYVVPLSEEKSRVYYSLGISMFDWVPKFVVEFMSSKGLTDATGWVKKFSELEYKKNIGNSKIQSKRGNVGEAAEGDVVVKKSKKFLGILNLFKGKEASKRKEAEKLAREQLEEAQVESMKKNNDNLLEVTWTRLVMVSLVSILGTYNIHLWLSQ